MSTASLPTRYLLSSGIVTLTVTLPETFVRAQALLGNEWHESYRYRIERVDDAHGNPTLFLYTYTINPRYPNKPARWVYTGILHPFHGSLRLTTRSAFPVTATRVRVADRVFRALFAGRGEYVANAGWTVTAEVEKELAGRF